MSAGVYNPYIEQGGGWKIQVVVTAPAVVGAYSAVAWLKADAEFNTKVLVEFSCTVVDSVPSAEGNTVDVTFDVSMTEEQGAALRVRGPTYSDTAAYAFEMWLLHGADDPVRILNGNAKVSPGGRADE